MAITAETRKDIIELVVTALNAAPGTTLLTEYVAIIDGGGTLTDVAAAIASSSNFTSLYPAFLTADEFADQWLATLVPEASAEALAEGKTVVTGLINSGASTASILIEAQSYLSALAETDTTFGTSAANFNNKVEVATYHTVTQKQDASSLAALQNVVSAVTSDDATVTTANGAVDSGGGTVSGSSTFTLTDKIDTISGTAGGDLVIGDNGTASTADTLELGEGADTLRLFGTGNVPSLNSVEALELWNLDTNLSTANQTSLTSVLVKNSTLTGARSLTLANGESLTLDTVNGAGLDLDLSTTKAEEMITINAVSSTGADLDLDLGPSSKSVTKLTLTSTGASSDLDIEDGDNKLETLVLMGDQNIDVSNEAITSLKTIDASGMTAGGSTVYVAAAVNTTFTGSPQNDTLTVETNTFNKSDTLDGGDGTDTLTLSHFAADTTITGDLKITNFETLRLLTDIAADVSIDMDNVAGLTSIQVIGTNTAADASNTHTLTDLATATTSLVFLGDGTDDIQEFDGVVMDWDTVTDIASATVTITNSGVEGKDIVIHDLQLAKTDAVTINATGIGQLSSEELSFETAVVMSGAKSFVLSADGEVQFSAGITGNDSLASIDATNADKGVNFGTISDVKAQAEISLGAGNDIITIAGADAVVLDAGAGNDTVDGGTGSDNITLGSGVDTLKMVGDATDKGDTITDFAAGATGDIIDFDTNGANNATNTVVQFASGAKGNVAATTGFQVFTDNITVADAAAGPTEAEIETYLGATEVFQSGAATDQFYLAVDNGTNTYVMLLDSAAANKVFTAAEDTGTVLLVLEGISDASTLTANNLADFLG